MFRSNTLKQVATQATKRAFNTAATTQGSGSNKLLLAATALTAVSMMAISTASTPVAQMEDGSALEARLVNIEKMLVGMKTAADEAELVKLVQAAGANKEMIMSKVSDTSPVFVCSLHSLFLLLSCRRETAMRIAASK
jgi:hypothetical protein